MRRVLLSSALLASTCALAACNPTEGVGGDPNSAVYGKAEPASSPELSEPVGTVVPYTAVTDLAAVGDTLAVRTEDSLAVGSAADFEEEKATQISVDQKCGDLTASDKHFLLACGEKVLLVDPSQPDSPQELAVDEEQPVTVAAEASSGEVFVGSKDSTTVGVYRDGERSTGITVEAGSDQLISVPVSDGADGIVRVLREDSTIQSLDWEKDRAGGRLRVGQGVGQIAGGEGAVVVASDTVGKRVAIYTSSDVIRLHQYGNTDGTPWGVAWDAGRTLAWVTTTDNNHLHAYTVSAGVPENVGTMDTVADARTIAVLGDGTLVTASASGEGLQFITDPQLDTSPR
ncbi:hypothetical protein J3S22_03445 [Corynebacterium aurimucosum]|uniref:hypothetical protein n=1 Tax=Corynebacterium aurimucosum TaxID=169292 RepID=UPI00191F06F6|nr:hypothetical protein [Corynebacterium aurimucosum]QQU96805.1 hypothetical protein I6I66_09185 [Corynebacterium aurimucosum]UTA72692.1 hypothetical protein J3S22_03445 [Corynebacterium aurimucosum]WJY70447.1 hypothetical protein CAURIM_06625 [Corynebacterium aurimucosum]